MGDIKERGINILPIGPKLGPLKSSEFADTLSKFKNFLLDELNDDLKQLEDELKPKVNYKPSRRERRKQQPELFGKR